MKRLNKSRFLYLISDKKHCENYQEDLELLANEMNYPLDELKQELKE